MAAPSGVRRPTDAREAGEVVGRLAESAVTARIATTRPAASAAVRSFEAERAAARRPTGGRPRTRRSVEADDGAAASNGHLTPTSDVRPVAQTEVRRVAAPARETDPRRLARLVGTRVAGDVAPLAAPARAALAPETAVRVATSGRRVIPSARVAVAADGVSATFLAQPAGVHRRTQAPGELGRLEARSGVLTGRRVALRRSRLTAVTEVAERTAAARLRASAGTRSSVETRPSASRRRTIDHAACQRHGRRLAAWTAAAASTPASETIRAAVVRDAAATCLARPRAARVPSLLATSTAERRFAAAAKAGLETRRGNALAAVLTRARSTQVHSDLAQDPGEARPTETHHPANGRLTSASVPARTFHATCIGARRDVRLRS